MGNYCCSIYKDRPERCKKYPERGAYQPESCTYYFGDEGERKGSCDPECDSTCCRLHRVGGEPGGAAMPEIAGGSSCKYLDWVEHHPNDRRSAAPEPDREGDRPDANPLELAVAAINRGEGDSASASKVGTKVRGEGGGGEG
jgi:hypothetical protein